MYIIRFRLPNISPIITLLKEPSVFKCQELKISSSHQEPKTIQQSASNEDDSSSHTCGICLDSLNHSNAVKIPCEHLFCRECWSRYLTLKILEGSQSVTCPALSCSILVPVELIETLVDRETARKYLHFDLNMFVSTNPSIRWCPKASCGRAIKLLVKEHNKVFLSYILMNVLVLKLIYICTDSGWCSIHGQSSLFLPCC